MGGFRLVGSQATINSSTSRRIGWPLPTLYVMLTGPEDCLVRRLAFEPMVFPVGGRGCAQRQRLRRSGNVRQGNLKCNGRRQFFAQRQRRAEGRLRLRQRKSEKKWPGRARPKRYVHCCGGESDHFRFEIG